MKNLVVLLLVMLAEMLLISSLMKTVKSFM
jgi:hypothetical protein